MFYLMRKNLSTMRYETDFNVFGFTEQEVVDKVGEAHKSEDWLCHNPSGVVYRLNSNNKPFAVIECATW